MLNSIASMVCAGIVFLLGIGAHAQVATTTTLTSSANRSLLGQPLVFTALVSPTNAPGTVQFGLSPPMPPNWISVALTNGVATLTTNGLPFGTNQITAIYVGEGGFNSSESPSLTQLVTMQQNLFASTFSGGQIIEYRTDGGQIIFASGLDYPSGLVFDAECNLYEADMFGSKIYEFTNPLTADETKITFASGLSEPTGLAFDAAGNLFLASYGFLNILEFTNGYEPGETPVTFAVVPANAVGLAFDAAGNLFVRSGGSIYEFTNGYHLGETPVTFASNLNIPVDLAFDSKGNLFLTLEGGNSILEFTNPLTAGETPLTFATNLYEPAGLAFDAMGNLFVGDGSGNIYVFATNRVRSTVATGLRGQTFLAFQPVPELQGAVGNGDFQLTVTMPGPYRPTIVQGSTDLINWNNIYTNTPPFTFTDLMTAGVQSRFYRALLRK